MRGEPGFLCPFMQVSPHLVYAERWSLEPKNGKSSLLVFGGDQTMGMDFFHHFLASFLHVSGKRSVGTDAEYLSKEI